MIYGIIKDKVDSIMNDRSNAGKRYFDLFMMFMVIGSVVILLFQVASGEEQLWYKFNLLDDGIIVVFIIEYLLRFWVCSSVRKDFRKAYRLQGRNWLLKVLAGLYSMTRNKVKFMVQPMSIIDLLAGHNAGVQGVSRLQDTQVASSLQAGQVQSKYRKSLSGFQGNSF